MQDKFKGVSRARHFGVNCSNIEKSIVFYRDMLGYEVAQDFVDSSSYISRLIGIEGVSIRMVKLRGKDGFVIELVSHETHLTVPHGMPLHTAGLAHLALQVESAEQIYQRLIAENMYVFSEPLLSSDASAKVFFCKDPDDVRIEIVEIL